MKIRTGLLAVIAAYAASVGSAHAFGLMDAFMAARQFDPQYRAAWQTREAGLQEERIARAQLLPQASFSYGYNRNWLTQNVENPQTGQTQTNSNDNYPSYVGRIEVRQPVVNFQGWAGLRQGQALSRMAEVEFDGRHQELMLRLYETYANTLLARDQLSIAQSQATALEEQMRSNDLMFKAGEGTRTDMIETRSRYDVARAQVIAAEDELGAALRELIGIVGPGQLTSVEQLDQLVPKFSPSPAQLESVEQWVQLGRTSNAQVAAGRFNVQAADANVDRSRAGHYPQLNLVAAHQRDEADSVSTINQRNRNSMIGVQLSVPIFSGGGVSAQTSQAVANYQRAQAELDATSSGVEVELRRQYALVQSNAAKIQALESAVESATLLVEATQKSVAGGMRVNLDVLNAEERLFTARRDLAQARYDYLNAFMQLRYYAGVLTVDDLQTVARYFAPPGTYGRDSAYSSNETEKIDMKAASRSPSASVGRLPASARAR